MSLTEPQLVMESARLRALNRKMQGLHLEKEPGEPMLNEHLWALVFQHLDTLQDHVKASTSCRGAWKAGLLKLDMPLHLPTEGTSQSICICVGQLVLQMDMTGRVLTCPLQHDGHCL